eukprot:g44198.t1
MLEEQCTVAHGGWAPDRRQHPVLRLLDVVAEHPLWGDVDRQTSDQWAGACVELYRRRLKPVHDLLQEPGQTQIERALTYLQNICARAGRPVTIAPTQKLSQELLGLVGEKLRLGVPGIVHAGGDFLYVPAPDYAAPHYEVCAFEAPKNRLHGLAAHWNSACVDELAGLSTPSSAPLPTAFLSLKREFRGQESAPGRAPGGEATNGLYVEGDWVCQLPPRAAAGPATPFQDEDDLSESLLSPSAESDQVATRNPPPG